MFVENSISHEIVISSKIGSQEDCSVGWALGG